MAPKDNASNSMTLRETGAEEGWNTLSWDCLQDRSLEGMAAKTVEGIGAGDAEGEEDKMATLWDKMTTFALAD